MDDKDKQILKYTLLAIKEIRADGDFAADEKAEMQSILAGLDMTRDEVLKRATNLLAA